MAVRMTRSSLFAMERRWKRDRERLAEAYGVGEDHDWKDDTGDITEVLRNLDTAITYIGPLLSSPRTTE